MKELRQPLEYVSTRSTIGPVGFKTALLEGLAPDGGLFVPTKWPSVATETTTALHSYSANAAHLIHPFVEAAIPRPILNTITEQAYTGFSHNEVAPLVEIGENHWLLELFHGPTLSFKDFALQILGRLFDYVLSENCQQITIIGATSGDTGSAAIAACKDRPNIDIFILHPRDRISSTQRRQMTSVLADNVHNIAVEGTFDDCQKIVKKMFNDELFRRELGLSAINSINWARILAQTVYYHVAVEKLNKSDTIFSVPTGNFGDVYSGYVAHLRGLPIRGLIVATNENDILVRALTTGKYQIGAVKPTIAPSMDIQVASNFERLLFELYNRDVEKVSACMNSISTAGGFTIDENSIETAQSLFSSTAIDERAMLNEMEKIFAETGFLIDPHTAVGVAAARKHPCYRKHPIISLSTADPSKFPEAVERATGKRPTPPPRLAEALVAEERYQVLKGDVGEIQAYIRALSRFAR